MAVEALDEVRATSPEPQENFWVMEVHRKEIKKMFYDCHPPGNIPARSISDLRNREMTKIAILEIAHLAAVQP